ncbi:MAG: pantetheine-phosphate adenylyltransferase [Candidatus Puniceispirillaceae bacterium]
MTQTGRNRIGLYPGTFDPLTLGHLDIMTRASQICDVLVIGVAENSGKSPIFSLEERLAIVQEQMALIHGKNKTKESQNKQIIVKSFTGLLTDFAEKVDASFIIRGLRAVSDFEYEFQMASANRRLKGNLETVFLTASENQHFVASSLVKEIAKFGGDISSFVPAEVETRIKRYFSG